MIQIHQIRIKLKKPKRIGRGGKRGTYSGRGIKGQKARAGHKIRPAIRELILKMPKLRGVKFKPLSPKPLIVNLAQIEKTFQEGEIVSFESLKEKKLIKPRKSEKKVSVKILGKGQLSKKLIFDKNLMFSEKAKEKIIKSGGKINE